MYQVNNQPKESRVVLVTNKVVGGILRHYIDEDRMTSILVRDTGAGIDYIETDEAHQNEYVRRITLEEANEMLDAAGADAKFRALILKDIE